MAWVDYEEYIGSERWGAMRMWALSRAGNRCEVCGNENGLEVHHRSYENLGCERPGDLLVLCDACHVAYGRKKVGDLDGRIRDLKGRVRAEPDVAKQLELVAELHALTQERRLQIEGKGSQQIGVILKEMAA